MFFKRPGRQNAPLMQAKHHHLPPLPPRQMTEQDIIIQTKQIVEMQLRELEKIVILEIEMMRGLLSRGLVQAFDQHLDVYFETQQKIAEKRDYLVSLRAEAEAAAPLTQQKRPWR